MKTIANLISFLAMFFLVAQAYTECYENAAFLPDASSVTPLLNVLTVLPDEGISDKDIQQHFLYADGVTANNRYFAVKTFDICGVQENIRLSVLLDYECRAP